MQCIFHRNILSCFIILTGPKYLFDLLMTIKKNKNNNWTWFKFISKPKPPPNYGILNLKSTKAKQVLEGLFWKSGTCQSKYALNWILTQRLTRFI